MASLGFGAQYRPGRAPPDNLPLCGQTCIGKATVAAYDSRTDRQDKNGDKQ